MKRKRNPTLPYRLYPGDVVGVISTSSPVDSREDLEKGLDALRSFGLVTKLGDNIMNAYGNFMAGTCEERLHDFHAMFADPEVRGIFCARGGDAALQLLPDINWNLVKKNPKIFMGYSDATPILLAILKKANIIPFHGPAIEREGLDPNDPWEKFTRESFGNILMEGRLGAIPHRTRWDVLRPGCVQGPFLGGNLNILSGFSGSRYAPDWDGAILFWEDIEEDVVSMDYFLRLLRVNGVFEKIRGMVIGNIADLQPIDEGDVARLGKAPTVEETILRATEGYDFPILSGVDFGHLVPTLTFPMGVKVLLDCPRGGREGNISILQKYLKERK